MRYALLSGAGNVFAVFDALADGALEDPGGWARRVCAPGAVAPRPDGLLLLLPPRGAGDVRMQLYNADGSAPETCGNGLRCIAKLAFERGHVGATGFVIEDQAGMHATQVLLADGLVVAARIDMGVPRIVALAEELMLETATCARRVRATLVDVGNPHCVLFVEDAARAPVAELGALLERHPRFERGANVGFLELAGSTARLRVWERGVGETRACGSGACAAAAAALAHGRACLPLRLELPGGALTVHAGEGGRLLLEGPVEQLGLGRLPRTTASA